MRKLELPGRGPDKPTLDEEDIELIREIGIGGVKEQAREIVRDKLSGESGREGKETPRAGNPVYKAMHACHADSRVKLSRAHRVPAGRDLTESHVEAIVNMLTRWIAREYNFYMEEKEEKQRSLSEFEREG
ncbi:MAG: DUF4186 family protein [Candidatus Nanohaloarchaea archaeon]